MKYRARYKVGPEASLSLEEVGGHVGRTEERVVGILDIDTGISRLKRLSSEDKLTIHGYGRNTQGKRLRCDQTQA